MRGGVEQRARVVSGTGERASVDWVSQSLCAVRAARKTGETRETGQEARRKTVQLCCVGWVSLVTLLAPLDSALTFSST